MHRRRSAAAGLALLVAACTTATSTPSATRPAGQAPSTGASPSPAGTAAFPPGAAPSPSAPAVPRPSGTNAWPAAFNVELAAGRYFTAPPFGIGLTLAIGEPGWFSGHLHPEYIDLLRFDGVTHDELPTRVIGFQRPLHVRGADGTVPVGGLTPDQAIDLLAGRASLELRNRRGLELFGREGVVVDLGSSLGNNPTFGGEAGELGVGGAQTTRMVVLPNGADLLVVIVVADPDDLDAAWAQAQPILESVELPG